MANTTFNTAFAKSLQLMENRLAENPEGTGAWANNTERLLFMLFAQNMQNQAIIPTMYNFKTKADDVNRGQRYVETIDVAGLILNKPTLINCVEDIAGYGLCSIDAMQIKEGKIRVIITNLSNNVIELPELKFLATQW